VTGARRTGTRDRSRRRLRFGTLLAAIAAVALFAGCERIDRNMWSNPAFKPQEEPVRLPPAASVPTKGIPHVPAPGTDAAKALRNPEKVTEASFQEGKELFRIYCTPCHGISGKGDGLVGKKLTPQPINISGSGYGGFATEGQLFAVVTHGVDGMPSFYEDLTPRERWRLVAYVKTLK
jgi:mono/diheme cytochrome c family protein